MIEKAIKGDLIVAILDREYGHRMTDLLDKLDKENKNHIQVRIGDEDSLNGLKNSRLVHQQQYDDLISERQALEVIISDLLDTANNNSDVYDVIESKYHSKIDEVFRLHGLDVENKTKKKDKEKTNNGNRSRNK